MINKAVFEICKPTMKVINVARGGIIDEKDLLEALNAGKCGGAALDVFESEPPKGLCCKIIINLFDKIFVYIFFFLNTFVRKIESLFQNNVRLKFVAKIRMS